MSEDPALERSNMTKERELTIEERQVRNAITKAQEGPSRSWHSSVEGLRQFGKIKSSQDLSPSAQAVSNAKNRLGPEPIGPEEKDPYKDLGASEFTETSFLSHEERERMAREQRAEYSKGSWMVEIIRTSDDPEAIRMATRDLMATIESNDEVPDIHTIDSVRKFLADRVRTYKTALDPEKAMKMNLEKYGLVERRVQVLARQEVVPGELWQVPVTEVEAAVLREILPFLDEDEAGRVAILDRADLKILLRSPIGRAIWTKTNERVIPLAYTKEQLERLIKACEEASDEMNIRKKIFTAEILYGGTKAQLGKLCALWIDGRYAGIGDKDWKTLFFLGELKEGEVKFGDKIDIAMRVFALLGDGGGGPEYLGVRREFAGREEKTAAVREARTNKILDSLRGQPPAVRELFRNPENLRKLIDNAEENIFCDTPKDVDVVKDVREWVIKTVNNGGDAEDTKSAVDRAWGLFFEWGIARQLDCRIYKREDGRFEPKGVPATDDGVKLVFFNEARAKDAVKGYPHGPDATLGMFPPEFNIMNFLQSVKAKDEDCNFWEQWWRQGKLLRELNWDHAGNAWFRYNEALYNFAGEKEKGDTIYSYLTKGAARQSDIINVDALRSFNKMLDKASNAWLIHTRNETEAKAIKERVKKQIRELFVYGNITNAFQNLGRDGALTEWVIFEGRTTDGKRAEKVIERSAFDIDIGEVRRKTKTFIEQAKIA